MVWVLTTLHCWFPAATSRQSNSSCLSFLIATTNWILTNGPGKNCNPLEDAEHREPSSKRHLRFGIWCRHASKISNLPLTICEAQSLGPKVTRGRDPGRIQQQRNWFQNIHYYDTDVKQISPKILILYEKIAIWKNIIWMLKNLNLHLNVYCTCMKSLAYNNHTSFKTNSTVTSKLLCQFLSLQMHYTLASWLSVFTNCYYGETFLCIY